MTEPQHARHIGANSAPTLPMVATESPTAQSAPADPAVGEFLRCVAQDMSDAEREYAIREAGKALEALLAKCEATGSVPADIAFLEDARRYMEALIRGRSDEQRQRMTEAQAERMAVEPGAS